MNENVQELLPAHAIATVGARSLWGGHVATGDDRVLIADMPIACVGDRVRYADGSEAVIVSGASCVQVEDRAVAAVGSRLDNGDVLIASPQSDCLVVVDEYEHAGAPGGEVR